MQTIAFFAMLRYNTLLANPHDTPATHLVVVPASVLSNWLGELERFAPHLKVASYHGTVVLSPFSTLSPVLHNHMLHGFIGTLQARDNARTVVRGGDVDVVLTTSVATLVSLHTFCALISLFTLFS